MLGHLTRRLLAPLLALLLLAPTAALAGSRTSLPLTTHWRFAKGDVAGAEQPTFDDRQWPRVTLPHSFNAGDGEKADYYRGPAWYRRTFEVPTVPRDRRLFVQFDGAATRADVYLNGRKIGRHDGGHATFRFDITDALVAGSNVLAVRVDNRWDKAITPLGGDFTLFGGLYRGVSLIVVDPVHIDLLDHGGPGVYAKAGSPRGKFHLRSVAVATRVRNAGLSPRRIQVVARLLDPAGVERGRHSTYVRLRARSVSTVQLGLSLRNARLWDGVRDPYFYRIAVAAGRDEVVVPFGFRDFRFDAAKGFFLNGKPYPLQGANLMHSARPANGTAVSDADVIEDFSILREMGSTGVRLTHFQHPQKAYEEADRWACDGAWRKSASTARSKTRPSSVPMRCSNCAN